MDVFVRPAQESDIEKIKSYIDEYGLDNENLDYRQFYIAEIANELAGFGRIKDYAPIEDSNKNSCDYHHIYELASIGVIEHFRGNDVGSKIIEKLISIAPSQEIWITTIIPEYFEKFGFTEDENIPDEILLKCKRVCDKLNKTTRNSRYMCYKKLNFF